MSRDRMGQVPLAESSPLPYSQMNFPLRLSGQAYTQDPDKRKSCDHNYRAQSEEIV